MSWWGRLRNRGRAEDELDRELRDHVERQVADHGRAGMPSREARRRARLEFGGLDQVKELCRDARGTRWIDRGMRAARSPEDGAIPQLLQEALYRHDLDPLVVPPRTRLVADHEFPLEGDLLGESKQTLVVANGPVTWP